MVDELLKTALEAKSPGIKEPTAREDILRRALKLLGLTLTDTRNAVRAVILLILSVAGLELLRHRDPTVFWVVMGIAALCLANVIWQLVPVIRQRRREAILREWAIKRLPKFDTHYFRVGPYSGSAADRKRYRRPDGADAEILAWVRAARDPLLYLSGDSGAGKSSLLNAALIPALTNPEPADEVEGAPGAGIVPFQVIALPEHGDAIAALREALLIPNEIWKDPSDKEGAPTAELLGDACRQLQKKGRRLLILCDQFEVTLIRHQNGNPEAAALAELLRNIADGRRKTYPGLCVLLTFRSKYDDLLRTLRLPRWVEGKNARRVAPFFRNVAREFLTTKGSGLQLAEKRLNEVLDEAEAVTGTPGLILPIVLNMLGKLLERHADREPEKLPRGALISHDLRRAVEAEEVRAHARPVLRALLENGVRVSRSAAETAQAEGLASEVVAGCYKKLLDWPLVRCVEDSDDPARTRWEIAHDFVARLLTPILETPLNSVAERLRRMATPALLLLAASTAIALWMGRENAIALAKVELSHQFGIQADVEGDRVVASVLERDKVRTQGLPRIAKLLNVLGSQVVLNLGGCNGLNNLDGFTGFTNLQSLNLKKCIQLRSVRGLKGLTNLQSLVLSDCHSLESVDGLEELTALQGLDLSSCYNLENVDGIKGLTALQRLDLRACHKLENIDGLKGLTTLQHLNLFACDNLQSFAGLAGLTTLQHLNLNDCPLENVDCLERLTTLRGLDLSGCNNLKNVNGLKGLRNLTRLNLSGCTRLTSVASLKGLPALHRLDLNNCDKLEDVDGLEGLPVLQDLDLSKCPELEDVDGLHGLPNLRCLDLNHCPNLENVHGLQGLTTLRSLNLIDCGKLGDIDGLQGLSNLEDLRLAGCRKLKNVDGLDELTALKRLDPRDIPIRDAQLIALKKKGVQLTLNRQQQELLDSLERSPSK
jgi:Leucine-rich repeat (LRR) protein